MKPKRYIPMRVCMRRVIRREWTTNKYCRPGEGRIEHHLECGHTVLTKQSDGTPLKKHCRDCERIAREVEAST